jgi:hypothetical protein
VSELALVTDEELRAELFAAGIGGASLDPTLAALRRRAPFERPPRGGPLAIARSRLDEARVAVGRGERAAALAALLDASRSGLQPAEAVLGNADPSALAWLRSAFAQVGDRIRSGAPPAEVGAAIADTLRALTHAEHVLGERDKPTGHGTFVSWTGWGASALFAALGMAALFGALRLPRLASHARLSRAVLGVLAAMGAAMSVATLARGTHREPAAVWPDEQPTSTSTSTTATGAADGPAQPPCSEPGFGPGPELHATEELLAFDVTHDCLFPGNSRLEIALNLRQKDRPRRAQVDALLRDLFQQMRAAAGTRVPELTHICVFAAGTVEWKDPYGCLEFEADEGPEGELAVRLDLPFEPDEWAKTFAASHTEGFIGSIRPRVTVDGARSELTIVYPYVEKGTDRWATRLTVPGAVIPFFPLLYDFYPPRTELETFVFVGTWKGKPVLTVRVADLKAFLSMDPWPIRERMAQARIPIDPDAERTAEQNATLGREYTEALAKLPPGSVVVDRALTSD